MFQFSAINPISYRIPSNSKDYYYGWAFASTIKAWIFPPSLNQNFCLSILQAYIVDTDNC